VGEISDILGRSYGCPDGIDESDLDAELACLEDDWAAEEISESTNSIAQDTPAAAPYLSSMPSQPTAAPHVFNSPNAQAVAPQYNSLV
jgi:charged multivesicular body protein 5